MEVRDQPQRSFLRYHHIYFSKHPAVPSAPSGPPPQCWDYTPSICSCVLGSDSNLSLVQQVLHCLSHLTACRSLLFIIYSGERVSISKPAEDFDIKPGPLTLTKRQPAFVNISSKIPHLLHVYPPTPQPHCGQYSDPWAVVQTGTDSKHNQQGDERYLGRELTLQWPPFTVETLRNCHKRMLFCQQ